MLFPAKPRTEGEDRVRDRRPGDQLRRVVPGDRRELQARRDRRRADGRDQRQRQPVHAARRLSRRLDRDEGAQARRLAAPRRGDHPHRARLAHRRGQWPRAATSSWRRLSRWWNGTSLDQRFEAAMCRSKGYFGAPVFPAVCDSFFWLFPEASRRRDGLAWVLSACLGVKTSARPNSSSRLSTALSSASPRTSLNRMTPLGSRT